ncbi:MAG: hypothetical protein M3337_01000 [Actinomycetota bacterium]|nr:hypothetical protein [Actinomycetota bacterium]
MTEIPEHLLKRSRERRAQLTGGTTEPGPSADAADSGDAGEQPASNVPATTAPAAAAPATGPASRAPTAAAPPAPEPVPDSPVVAAAKSRPKIPFWAMAGLSLMPIWAFMYVRALTEPPEVPEGPLGIGAAEFGSCASCHGTGGELSSSARQLSDGEVLLTFPNIEDQLRWVYFGSQEYQLAGVTEYGNPEREGGSHPTGSIGAMPGQGENAGGSLTDAEILAVVCHERYTLSGGADPTDEAYTEEFENWCSDESPVFEALEGGEATFADLADAGIVDAEGNQIEMIPVGEEPIAGSPPSP